MASFDKVIPSILAHEGGFVDDPDDPGGVTNFGITLPWLKQFEPLADRSTIVNMKVEEAKSRYYDYIWKRLGYDRFGTDAAAEKVMDMAVNFGEQRGHELAQAAANSLIPITHQLKIDGDLGPKSFSAMNALDQKLFIEKMKALAAERYNRIVLKRPTSLKYLKNWLRRAGCATYSKCRTCRFVGLKDEALS
jgi:lysozyme family protein